MQLGLIDKAGAWYSYRSDRIGQGKSNAADFLQENYHMAAEIEKQIRVQLLGEAEDDDIEDNVTPITSA